MPAKFRLTRADFNLISSQRAQRIRGAFFTLSTTPLPLGTISPKIACVVSKKAARSAVDRNRVRRRCRAALRPLMAQIKDPVAIVFYATKESVGAEYSQLSADIEYLLKKGGLLR